MPITPDRDSRAVSWVGGGQRDEERLRSLSQRRHMSPASSTGRRS